MTRIHATAWAEIGAADLGPTIERVLRRTRRDDVRVVALSRQPNAFATVFPAETVRVRLSSGEELSLFVKHLGSEDRDHPEKDCREREVLIYEKLFADRALPVPRFFGSAWNRATKRQEVFLEYVDDWNLKYHELDYWFTTASELARFHAHFASRAEELAACAFLVRLDEAAVLAWADRALVSVRLTAPEFAGELETVVSAYGVAAGLLARQPPTLVHNDLSPKNVIVDRTSSPARICFIDWEMAGVGCGLLDLVHLKYGLDGESDSKMCAAYCKALEGTALLPPNVEELSRLFAACELHKTFNRLWRNQVWQLPAERVGRWVREAQALLGQASTGG